MKTLLLTLVFLGLAAALQAQDPLPLQPEEPDITGTWFMKAVVANRNLTQTPRQAFPLTVTAQGGVNFETKVTFTWRGGCYKNSLRFQKTEEPSEFTFWNHTRIHIEKLPVQDHYICYAEHQLLFGETMHVGYLMGEGPGDPSPCPTSAGEAASWPSAGLQLLSRLPRLLTSYTTLRPVITWAAHTVQDNRSPPDPQLRPSAEPLSP
ncbi:PREDICTED: major allergen Can f 1-like [Chinchilla lanigera]|uniref:major allergen Can f 1-like n=1 Tax=Chinchilla lanigera TaxID=34839 RepID=UPI0006974DE0|nr:PREDICTED: major allergen Can f 1-like [Chinchilla lanigera]